MITLEDFNRVRHRQITQIHERAITPTDDKVGQIIFEMSNLAVQDSRNAAVGEPWSNVPLYVAPIDTGMGKTQSVAAYIAASVYADPQFTVSVI